MIVVTQTQLRNKDTEAIVLLVVFLMVKLNVEKVDVELLEEERVDYDTM